MERRAWWENKVERIKSRGRKKWRDSNGREKRAQREGGDGRAEE